MELFGGMPDAVKFITVFLLILGILVPLLWRRFSAGSLSPLGARGRQPRLAVIDTATVDVRRKLVLIKRDNVEHLLLIGGPSDIVVESGIARTATVAREPRPIPDISHPEVSRQPAAADAPDWSLPLEPMARPARTVDLDAALPEPPARTAREAMVDSMRAVRSGAAARRNAPVELDAPHEEIAAPALTPPPAEVNHRPPPPPEPRREPQRPHLAPEPAPPSGDAPESKRERGAAPAPRPAPAAAAPAGGAVPPLPRPVQPVPPPAAANMPPPPPRPVQSVPPAATSAGLVPPSRPAPSDESNLAEMAQRLEAALRRPTKPEAPPPPPPTRQPVRPESPGGRRQAHFDAAGPGKANLKSPDPQSPDLKIMPGKGKSESAIESLEDEMAKMLGRPGKS